MILLLSNTLVAKENLKKDSVKFLIDKASVLAKNGEYTKSNEIFKRVLSLLPSDSSGQTLLKVIKKLGGNYIVLGDYDNALISLFSALKISDSGGIVNKDVASSIANIAFVLTEYGYYDSSKVYFDSARVVYDKLYDPISVEYADLIENEGILYYKKGNFEKALKYAKRVLEIRKELFGENSYDMSSSHYNLSILYGDMKNQSLAIEHMKKSLAIREKLVPPNHESLGIIHNGLGTIYWDLEDYDEALNSFETALNIYKKKPGHPLIFWVLGNIGTTHSYLKNYQVALRHLKESLELAKRIYGEKSNLISSIYNSLGAVYEGQGDLDAAIESYHKGVMASSFNFNDSTIYNNPDMKDVIFADDLHDVLLGKARCAFKKYERDKFQTDLLLTYETISLGNSFSIEYLKKNGSDKSILTFLDTLMVFNKKLIDIAIPLLQNGHEGIISDIYTQVSGNKSKALNFDINTKAATIYANIPDSLLNKENDLLTKLSFRRSELIRERKRTNLDSLKINKLEKSIFELNRKKDQLLAFMESNFQEYYAMRHDHEPTELVEIQNKLKDDEGVLEYVYGENDIYVFSITKNDFELTNLGSSLEIDSLISVFSNSISNSELKKIYETGYALYLKLIMPIGLITNCKALTIIPDGYLWGINFDMFLTDSIAERDKKKPMYLLNKYAVNYLYFSKQLVTHKNKTTFFEDDLIAFSYGKLELPKKSGQLSLNTLRTLNNELPGTWLEIKSISTKLEGSYFYGDSASEHNFKTNAGKFKIIHLALHGVVDHKDPSQSKLSFFKGGSVEEDGQLYVFELLNMSLNSELAVLSACNTGSGYISKGEGVMSLGRAFTYAGVESLMLTHWPVSDQATPKIMSVFYDELKSGKRKSEALRVAKLNYLKNADNISAAPFYWGSFYLLGDDDPIEFTSNTEKYLLLSLGLLVLILAFLYFLNRNNPKKV